jgi:polyphosphate kinase
MTGNGADRTVTLLIEGTERHFDIDNPDLPDWVGDNSLAAGTSPYPERMKRKAYEAELELLQMELVKVQAWQQQTGHRIIAVFEGRDAAGKGGAIGAIREYMNPRQARIVALPKPSDTERGQWYYQRYVDHFPTSGECVLFDRSWYNRAGVEPVMCFCTPDEHAHFLEETPHFERMLAASGIHLFKFWLDIGRATQIARFHERRHTPLKAWKLSPMDIASLERWDDYTDKRDLMFSLTHTVHAPWTVVNANDHRRARLNLIRHMLQHLPYTGRDDGAAGPVDRLIVGHPAGENPTLRPRDGSAH